MTGSNHTPHNLRFELHQSLAVVWAFITIILSVLLREETRWTLLVLWGVSVGMFIFYAAMSVTTYLRAQPGREASRPQQ